MLRTKTVIAGTLVALASAGCGDPSLGGNVANGDSENYPTHRVDPEVANSRNPTGNQSGPWVGEYGLRDTTTGVNDRVGEPTSKDAQVPDSSRAPGPRIESSDEQTSRTDLPKPDPAAEMR